MIEAGGRHGREWVLPESVRDAIGDDKLWALTKGRKFEGGGNIDEFGNPIQPGMMPGPSTAPVAPIAPNPMAGSGGLTSIISGVTQGIQGPIGNVLSLGNDLLNNNGQQQGSGGLLPTLGAMDPASVSARASQVPGLIGLFGSMNSANPDAAVANWANNTMKWTANWGTKLAGGLASTLWQGGLSFFGLENSILSPSNVYNQAASQGAQFALGQDGPIGTLLGINGSGSSATGGVTDPGALAQKYGVVLLDDATLAGLTNGPGTSGDLSAVKVGPAGAGDGGLQVNTLRGKQIIQKNFPWATNIGGVRKDKLHWHPDGLALDVMIPGAGGLNDPTPAAGKAQGDQLYAWLNAHKKELGIDYIMWQEKDHFNHLHVNFAPSGPPPAMAAGGPTPSRKGPGPTGGFLAEVHPDEFMISARGRASVPDAFLHKLNQGLIDPKDLPGFADGGDPSTALVIPPPRPNFDPGQGIKPQIVRPPSVPVQPRPAPAPAPPPAPVDAAPADASVRRRPSQPVPGCRLGC